MIIVDIHDAKSRLSALVEAIESSKECEIVITRNGQPVARMVPVEPRQRVRLGLAEGRWVIPDNIDRDEEEIIRLFEGEDE